MEDTIYSINYQLLNRVLGCEANSLKFERSFRYKAAGYMDFIVEKIADDEISIAHYYEQNGDLMRDPEMVIKIYPETKCIEALMFQQDAPPVYQQVYKSVEGKIFVHRSMKNALNSFLRVWLRNLIKQGHKLASEE